MQSPWGGVFPTFGTLNSRAYTTGGTEPAGLLKEMLDPLGRLTSYTYDQHGQLISTTNPAGQTTTYTYDALGRRLTTTYPGGRTDWNCYDAAGRVVRSVANASGANPCDPNYIPNGDPAYDRITTTAYDLRGNVIATIDAVGLVTRTYYDNANRPTLVVRNLTYQDYSLETPPPYTAVGLAENLISETVYDGRGNAIAQIAWARMGNDVIGRITRTYYDDLNRAEYVVQNLTGWGINEPQPPPEYLRTPNQNIITRTFYGMDGSVQKTTDNAGRVTHYCYRCNGKSRGEG